MERVIDGTGKVGRGTAVTQWEAATGTVRVFSGRSDVLESLGTDLGETVALIASARATFLGPILERLRGVICLSGTLESHIAIVSREYDLPCIVGLELTEELLTGQRITLTIDPDGTGVVTRA